MIGKLPKPEDPSDCFGINYYKSGYYIMNLKENTSERLKPKCYISDLEGVFRCQYDCFRVFDEFVYDDNYEYSFNISDEQRNEYLAILILSLYAVINMCIFVIVKEDKYERDI